jgi:predicted GNAT family acetyltransferase
MDYLLVIILIILAIPFVKYCYDTYYNNKKTVSHEKDIETPFVETPPPIRIKMERGNVTKCVGVSHCHADIGTITALQVDTPNFKILPFKKVPPDMQEIVATKLKSLNPKMSKHYITENWNGSDIMYVMISKDNKFIGTVAVDRKNFDPYISHLFVDPTFRKKGYGERLLDHGIDYARLFKFDAVKIWCVDSLVPYYSSKGWVQEKLSKDNNGNEVWILSYK